MFEVEIITFRKPLHYCIQDNGPFTKFLHSNGSVYRTPEYWPTREPAQAVLDKYQPKHVWEHGDVFENCAGTHIYLQPDGGDVSINLLYVGRGGTPDVQMADGDDIVFLFNIKDKLPC